MCSPYRILSDGWMDRYSRTGGTLSRVAAGVMQLWVARPAQSPMAARSSNDQ